MKADNGFQDNYSVVVASGTWLNLSQPATAEGHRARLITAVVFISAILSMLDICDGRLTHADAPVSI